jgi:hypothetical protein
MGPTACHQEHEQRGQPEQTEFCPPNHLRNRPIHDVLRAFSIIAEPTNNKHQGSFPSKILLRPPGSIVMLAGETKQNQA